MYRGKLKKSIFLYDQSWISPWIKSISNELNITIHVNVISNRLWRHQQNENRTRETRGRCVKIVVFIVIFGFVMWCKNKIMYCRDELFLRSIECYFGTYFPCCFATRETHTKITLSWALKQFLTRVHALFCIYVGYETDGGKRPY